MYSRYESLYIVDGNPNILALPEIILMVGRMILHYESASIYELPYLSVYFRYVSLYDRFQKAKEILMVY